MLEKSSVFIEDGYKLTSKLHQSYLNSSIQMKKQLKIQSTLTNVKA